MLEHSYAYSARATLTCMLGLLTFPVRLLGSSEQLMPRPSCVLALHDVAFTDFDLVANLPLTG